MSRVSSIQLPGVRNLRDAGGHTTSDGRTMSLRRVYRAEALVLRNANESNAMWLEEESAVYASIGLTAVIDLRAEEEAESAPSAWSRPTNAKYIPIPLPEGAPGSDTDLLRPVLTGRSAAFSGEDLGAYYVTLLEGRAKQFGAVVETIADNEGGPLLIHCSAGKDRTALAIALVLDTLGVPREAIVRDYELTGVNRPNRMEHYREAFAKRNVQVEDVRAAFETPRVAMVTAWDHIDKEYGSAEEYLLESAGTSPEVFDALREILLEG
ncbi:protein-tyrosine phosphatase [Brevibacterium sandarakinum]|uniref:Protein-tyrosine phosphatase n=1 Tax=Brevibacterium sandarakinum TaxID=629680 RepID=A0A1H1SLL0_BRESA|nr:tyrosine-protein phosphatase [Brevibacterium sandarakinum]SDS48626.1 protein-tyrosine phosphatase [Brevibacterium sandarakinum]